MVRYLLIPVDIPMIACLHHHFYEKKPTIHKVKLVPWSLKHFQQNLREPGSCWSCRGLIWGMGIEIFRLQEIPDKCSDPQKDRNAIEMEIIFILVGSLIFLEGTLWGIIGKWKILNISIEVGTVKLLDPPRLMVKESIKTTFWIYM